jgi:hypothetical protein
MSADYQGEIRVGAGREAGGSQRPRCGRWIGDPRLECSRRFTSLWIGTTAKVRLAVVPLPSGARELHAAVNIRGEFEKRKPSQPRTLTNHPGGSGLAQWNTNLE